MCQLTPRACLLESSVVEFENIRYIEDGAVQRDMIESLVTSLDLACAG